MGCKNCFIPSDGSVISIIQCAFAAAFELTEITIPSSVTSIGYQAFSGCTGLESITVEQGNPVYHGAGNCIIETASKKLVAGCKNSIIPDDGSVTHIDTFAFGLITGLTEITLPDSIESIGRYAFSGCEGLTDIFIPASVTSMEIDVFMNCPNLTIYCEAESQPAGWRENWNSGGCTVVWGYKG